METISVKCLLELATEFGLACIERDGTITVIGEQQVIIFYNSEGTCQLIEI